MNQKSHLNTSSKYKGVSWHKIGHKWQVHIQVIGKKYYLGLFVSDIEAAKVYDEAARNYFGEYAHTNFERK